jgi:hypothetical protein
VKLRRCRSTLFVAWLACAAQEPSKLHAPWVDCQGETSRTERTAELLSPDGRQRAFAEIRAVYANGCANTSTLFVDGKPVFVQTPEEPNGNANSLGPVAWSPDSRWLLVERGLWVYASDFGATSLMLYDARTATIQKPDVPAAIARKLRKKCVIGFSEMIGFDNRNRAHVRVGNWYDEGEEEPVTKCLNGVEEWVFDPLTKQVRRATTHRGG